jgi:hypothetical protein
MKKGQMKIQETAFVLLGLALLFTMVFLFFIRFQTSNIQMAAETVKQEQAISILEKISAMPELRCSYYGIEKLCIDEDKIKIFQPMANSPLYIKQWAGLQRVSIKQIWPNEEEFQIYNKGSGNFTYSTFINICTQKYTVTSSWVCSLGMMEVSYSI